MDEPQCGSENVRCAEAIVLAGTVMTPTEAFQASSLGVDLPSTRKVVLARARKGKLTAAAVTVTVCCVAACTP